MAGKSYNWELVSPEKRFIIALLERHVLDLKDPKERRSAKSWVDSNETSPFTFKWICQTLSLSASTVRKIKDS